MSEVKWISIVTDIFNDEKMCTIESMPDGLNIEIVWFKLLCLAGTCNENGFLMINRNIPYTDEMMAKYFRMDIGIVQRALETFQNLRMVEIVDDIYMVSNWMKYQNNASLEHIRMLNNARQQRFRNRQKKTLLENSNVTDNVTNNVTNNDFCCICNMSYKDIFNNIVNYLNSKSNTNYKPSSRKTQMLIRARINEGFLLEDFYTVIDKKCAEWMNTDMARYLRPETLFGTKFESYLNQIVTVRKEIKTGFDTFETGE